MESDGGMAEMFEDWYSFVGCSSLNCVTLPDDCTYYADSFPDTCVVTGGILME